MTEEPFGILYFLNRRPKLKTLAVYICRRTLCLKLPSHEIHIRRNVLKIHPVAFAQVIQPWFT